MFNSNHGNHIIHRNVSVQVSKSPKGSPKGESSKSLGRFMEEREVIQLGEPDPGSLFDGSKYVQHAKQTRNPLFEKSETSISEIKPRKVTTDSSSEASAYNLNDIEDILKDKNISQAEKDELISTVAKILQIGEATKMIPNGTTKRIKVFHDISNLIFRSVGQIFRSKKTDEEHLEELVNPELKDARNETAGKTAVGAASGAAAVLTAQAKTAATASSWISAFSPKVLFIKLIWAPFIGIIKFFTPVGEKFFDTVIDISSKSGVYEISIGKGLVGLITNCGLVVIVAYLVAMIFYIPGKIREYRIAKKVKSPRYLTENIEREGK